MGCCWWWRDAAMRFASSWSRRTRRAYGLCRSSQLTWSSNTRGCISTVSSWTSSAVVGSAAETPALIDRQSQIAQVLQCAEVVGILQTVFDFTVQWALDRHTFGRPLASYQALKHGFADMKLWLEACRATTAAAVADVAARSPAAGLSASIAKSYVGEMARPDRPGLRADARRHRCHLGARPAPLPEAGCVVPLHVRHAGGTQPTGVRGGESGSFREMTTDHMAPTESVARVRRPGQSVVGGQHACHRPRLAAGRAARRRARLATGPRTAKAALRRRIRRYLLSPRVRWPGSGLRVPEGIRRGIRSTTRCR